MVSAIPITLGGAPGVPGEGSLILRYAVPATLAGQTLYVQTFTYDPAATSAVSQTNGVRITYGR